jgi:2-methylcitrate dehydratase PrpD
MIAATNTTAAGLPELLERLDGFDPAGIDTAARRHAALVLADTIGAVMAGCLEPEIRALITERAAAEAPGPVGGAAVLAPGLPMLPLGTAALINGTAAVILELDEGHRPTGHPGAHIVPAALAVAHATGASGRALLDAVMLGYEVMARLFAAYKITHPLHCHGNFGTVGAAVAAAHLRGRPLRPAGLVASALPLLTTWPACLEGATVRNTWSGLSGWIGVLANDLANAGFVGSERSTDAAFGELVGRCTDPGALAAPLDPGRLMITTNYFKRHSCCASAHAAIDAVLELGPVDPTGVDDVLVETVTNNLKIVPLPGSSALSRRFSLPFAVSTALVHGHAHPAAFTQEPDPRVLELAHRIRITTDPDFEPLWPDASPARVTVTSFQRSRTAYVENAKGYWSNPLSGAELRKKFATLAWAADPSELYDRILAIDSLANVRTLFDGAAADVAGADR